MSDVVERGRGRGRRTLVRWLGGGGDAKLAGVFPQLFSYRYTSLRFCCYNKLTFTRFLVVEMMFVVADNRSKNFPQLEKLIRSPSLRLESSEGFRRLEVRVGLSYFFIR